MPARLAKKDRIEQILDALKKASAGDYSPSLTFASQDDDLGRIAEGINRLLKKTGQRISPPKSDPPAISNRRRAPSQHLQAEERYRNLLDEMEETYLELDLKGNYIFFNEALCRILGYPRKELQNMNYRKINLPEEHHEIFRQFNEIYRTGKAKRFINHAVRRKDGSIRYLEFSMTLLRSPSGEPIGFGGVGRDVTERIKAQDKIEESERHLRFITANIRDIIWTLDFDLHFTYVSPSVQRVLGFAPEELVGQPLKSITPPESYAEVERRVANGLAREAEDAPPEETASRVELQLTRKDGSPIWVEVSAAINRDETGRPCEIVGITRDISERKLAEEALRESEKRYRLMAENVNDVIWIMALDLGLKHASPSNLRVTGYTPEEAMALSIQDVTTPESLEIVSRILTEELAAEENGAPVDPNRSRTIEIEARAKGGYTYWLEVTATFNRDAAGKPTEILAVGRNITERKKIERALAESERRYRMIAENMNDVVWRVGLDLQFRYVSPSSTRVSGYTPEEVLKTPLAQLITPESYSHATATLARELALEASGRPFDPNRAITIEVEAIRKDGSPYWLEITGTSNRDPAGKISEILVVGRNVTARKQAESDLAKSQKLYQMIVENIQDSISLLDLNFNYLYISPSEVRITGYSPGELMQIPPEKQTTPECYALLQKMFAEEIANESGGKPVDPNRSRTIEIEVFHKNGGKVWVELVLSFYRDEGGRPIGILISSRDITERRIIQNALRQSESRYRLILDNIQEVIWTTDLNLQTTYVSPSCEQIIGYSSEEASQIPLAQLLTHDSFHLAQKTLTKVLSLEKGDEPVNASRTRTLEQEMYHKDGGTVLLEVTATFIRDKGGLPTGLLLAGRDITERKKAEEEKKKLEGQLIQAQKLESVGRLADGVAHDFNNMLSVILGYADIAKQRLAKDHSVLKDLVEIEKAALRSREITSKLLAFSRKQLIAPEVVDLNDVVVNMQKALARLICEDIHLSYHPQEHLWPIMFDPSQIEQILMNLAVNARDAMPQGGKLTIETANVTLDPLFCEKHAGLNAGDYVRLSVIDDGTGMDQETLQCIFEPFFTTKEEGKGTGLGLAMVYSLVTQNKGLVDVHSKPGHGATFTIYLPRTREQRRIEQDAGEGPAIQGEGNILLVEDDPMVLEIAREMLEMLGYGVKIAKDPLDAIRICKEDLSLNLVITDVIMPTMKGKELRDRLEAIRPGIKVLFMSGYAADIIAQHGVLEEGVHFLPKPFTMKGLAQKVKEAMSSR